MHVCLPLKLIIKYIHLLITRVFNNGFNCECINLKTLFWIFKLINTIVCTVFMVCPLGMQGEQFMHQQQPVPSIQPTGQIGGEFSKKLNAHNLSCQLPEFLAANSVILWKIKVCTFISWQTALHHSFYKVSSTLQDSTLVGGFIKVRKTVFDLMLKVSHVFLCQPKTRPFFLQKLMLLTKS